MKSATNENENSNTKYTCRLLLHLWGSSTRVIHRNWYHKSTSCVKVSASIVAQTASMLDRRALRLTDDSTARVHRPRRPPISLESEFEGEKIPKFQLYVTGNAEPLCGSHIFQLSGARRPHKKNRSQVLDGVGEQEEEKKVQKIQIDWFVKAPPDGFCYCCRSKRYMCSTRSKHIFSLSVPALFCRFIGFDDGGARGGGVGGCGEFWSEEKKNKAPRKKEKY